ncbi:MAG: hypothetical protein V2J55_03895 [Candidatus Competibacteraceae bacterium]|jgi:hypothetical protein|nr:hypothetical protein [Candidatus Competibacteraceae bacterium]
MQKAKQQHMALIFAVLLVLLAVLALGQTGPKSMKTVGSELQAVETTKEFSKKQRSAADMMDTSQFVQGFANAEERIARIKTEADNLPHGDEFELADSAEEPISRHDINAPRPIRDEMPDNGLRFARKISEQEVIAIGKDLDGPISGRRDPRDQQIADAPEAQAKIRLLGAGLEAKAERQSQVDEDSRKPQRETVITATRKSQESPIHSEYHSHESTALAAQGFLTQRESLENLSFQPANGYWANTYIPGDPAIRLLAGRLRHWDRTGLGA